MRKRRLINLSPIRRKISQSLKQSKPLQYVKAFFHIFLKVQPFFSIFVALLISLPLVIGFTYAIDASSNNTKDSIYTEGVIGTFSRIDPLPQSPLDKPFSQVNRDITRLIFDPLFSSDANGTITNILADTFDVQDNGSKYTVVLKDRKWSNGKSVTAQDVKDTFETIKKIGSGGLYFAAIDGVDASVVDEKTIQFTLALPNGTFLDTLYWPVLPSSALTIKYDQLVNSDFGVNPITDTGWKIDSLTDRDVTLINSNEKGIKFVFYNDLAQLDKALNAGFIDGYYSYNNIAPKNYIDIRTYVLPRQLYSLYFNSSDTATSDAIKDPVIKKAISYGIDRKDVAEDLGVPRQSVINENSWAFNPAVNTYPYDPTKAQQILDDAGYKMDGEYRKANGKDIEFTLSIPDVSVRVKQAKKIEDQMKKIGIKVNVKPIKDSGYVDNELKGNLFYKSVVLTRNFDAMIYSIDSSLDPDKFSQWHSSKIPNFDKNILGLNFSGYSDFRVDEYLRQGRSKYDQASRKTSYFQFQKVFYDDPPVVTLYNPYLFYATSKKVKNVDFTNAVRIEDRFINFDKWEF